MSRAGTIAWSLYALIVAVLALHAAYYLPFFSDDALISLRYSQRLCHGLGLTWTDGEPVEGYTDLLWVLLNAPAACVRLDPIWSARALDFLGAAVAAYVVALPAQGGTRVRIERLATASAIFVLSAPVAVWTIGGLEHGFMLGVLALALFFGRRATQRASQIDTLRASLCFGVLALLRADGVVLFAAATVGRMATHEGRRGGLRAMAAWVAFPAALLAGQLMFRIAYYHALVPNTAIAKVSFSWLRLHDGVAHLVRGYLAFGVLSVAVLASLALMHRSVPKARWAMPIAVAIGWPAYLAIVGGDIFPGWRQLLLGIVPLAFIVGDAAEASVARMTTRNSALRLAGWAVALAAHVALQVSDSENQRAKDELWEWDGRAIGKALGRAFAAQRPLLAVDAAGALPFWSGLPALDMLGLNDSWIAHHPPAGFGRGMIGHELGDPDYVWRRSPDIFAFTNAAGSPTPLFLAGRALVGRKAFIEAYQLVTLQGRVEGPIGYQYFKREGGPLGLRRTDGELRIPGYLFTQGSAVARPDRRRRLCTFADAEHPAQMDALRLGAGTWKLTTTPAPRRLQAAFACGGNSPRRLDGSSTVLKLDVAATVDIVLAPFAGEALALDEVRLTRSAEPPGMACDARTPRAIVTRTLADLHDEIAEGAYWASPAAVRFDRHGLEVALAPARFPAFIDVTADGNDRYLIRFFSDGEEVGRVTAQVADFGLRTRSIALPARVTQRGTDRILVTPIGGDHAYSVARIALRG